jgi:hypothetical protein
MNILHLFSLYSSLDKMGRKHKTDKSSKYHDYLKFYEKELSQFSERKFNLIEFGSMLSG